MRHNKFDWLISVGDDNIVFTGYLRQYLKQYESLNRQNIPVFLSDAVEDELGLLQTLGGSGAVLNAAALRLLVSRLPLASCSRDAISPQEDRFLTRCLGKAGAQGFEEKYSLNFKHMPDFFTQAVYPARTEDNFGRKRFLNFCPQAYDNDKTVRLGPAFQPCGKQLKTTAETVTWLGGRWVGGPFRLGRDCCVPQPITFHYLTVKHQKAIAAYAACSPDPGHKVS